MENSRGEIGRWLVLEPNSWSADLQRLEDYAGTRGLQAPGIRLAYGQLSSLAHPTRDACENSAALIASRIQMFDPDDRALAEAIARFETEPAALLYRLLWVALDRDVALLEVGIRDANVPNCTNFTNTFNAIEAPSAWRWRPFHKSQQLSARVLHRRNHISGMACPCRVVKCFSAPRQPPQTPPAKRRSCRLPSSRSCRFRSYL